MLVTFSLALHTVAEWNTLVVRFCAFKIVATILDEGASTHVGALSSVSRLKRLNVSNNMLFDDEGANGALAQMLLANPGRRP